MNNSTPSVSLTSRSTGTETTTSSESGIVYAFDGRSAVLSAILATIAITLYMLYVPRLLGIEEMDIGITVGRIVSPEGGTVAFLARLAWHVGHGLVYVFIYAAILWYFQKQSSLLTGMVFGLFLVFAGPMFLIPILLDFHPAIASGQLINPGIMMLDLNHGWKPAATDVGAHLIHGIMTGVIYKHRVVHG